MSNTCTATTYEREIHVPIPEWVNPGLSSPFVMNSSLDLPHHVLTKTHCGAYIGDVHYTKCSLGLFEIPSAMSRHHSGVAPSFGPQRVGLACCMHTHVITVSLVCITESRDVFGMEARAVYSTPIPQNVVGVVWGGGR